MLATALGAICLLEWLCWAASYLAWPWSPDHDVFATLARSWDAGILPYRDMYANNPPVTIYLYWVLGKLFGWGRTSPFFAVDAAMVEFLGIMMVHWSIRRFGSILPAMVGYLWFLGYYFGLDYAMAGERDWHAALLAVAAIMAAQAWPGRVGCLTSAVAAALAFAMRPQAALFLPALALALGADGQRARGLRGGATREWLEWLLAFTATVVLLITPLLLVGILDDFLRSFQRGAYGGMRDPLTPAICLGRILIIIGRREVLAVLIAVSVLAAQANLSSRRSAWVWLAALAAAILYKPISPRQHDYLDLPRFLLLAVNLSVLVGLAFEIRGIPAIRLAIIGLALGLPGRGEPPHGGRPWSFAPLGRAWWGVPLIYPDGYAGQYSRPDYKAMLIHLDRTWGPDTRIANALAYPLAITGPTGRLSAFPAESLAWLRWVRPDDEGAFTAVLERTPDSVVVWCPREFDKQLSGFRELRKTIRRLYEPESRFGDIEIWRRKTEPLTG